MKNRVKGTLTVFFALVFLALMLLFGTLYDGIRSYETKKIAMEYEYLSLDNELAGYVRELWDDYHLLFMDTRARQTKLDEPGLPNGFIKVTIMEGSLVRSEFFKDEGVFAGQIKEYMKYASIPELIMLLASAEEKVEENEKTGNGIKKRLSTEQKCADVEEIKNSAMRKAGEIRKAQSVFLNSAEFTDDDKRNKGLIFKHVSELLSQTDDVKKDINRYEDAFSDAQTMMHEYERENEEDADYASLKTLMSNGKSEIKMIRTEMSTNETRLKEVQSLCLDKDSDTDTVIAVLNTVNYSSIAGDSACDKTGKSDVYKEKLGDLLSKGVLKLVLPKETTVSKKQIKKPKDNGIRNTADKDNSVLTSIYLYKHFGNFIRESEKAGALAYELEYMICGKEKDSDNLAGIAEILLAIRTGANIVKILKDPERVAKAGELALVTAGASGNAVAVLAVKTTIITYWATLDAIEDLKKLYNGEDVDGLNYEKYLMILIISKKEEKLLKRSAVLIEKNMKERYDNCFALDNLYAKVGKNVKVTIHNTFSNDLIFERTFNRSY